MAEAELLDSATYTMNPISSFRNFGNSHGMTLDQTAHLFFTMSDDDDDDVILNKMHAVISKEEIYLNDVTFYCIWELFKIEKQGNLESAESLQWLVDACHTRSRCKTKNQNYEYLCTYNGRLLHGCLSCRKKPVDNIEKSITSRLQMTHGMENNFCTSMGTFVCRVQ